VTATGEGVQVATAAADGSSTIDAPVTFKPSLGGTLDVHFAGKGAPFTFPSPGTFHVTFSGTGLVTGGSGPFVHSAGFINFNGSADGDLTTFAGSGDVQHHGVVEY
jgi:hypothetical protein